MIISILVVGRWGKHTVPLITSACTATGSSSVITIIIFFSATVVHTTHFYTYLSSFRERESRLICLLLLPSWYYFWCYSNPSHSSFTSHK